MISRGRRGGGHCAITWCPSPYDHTRCKSLDIPEARGGGCTPTPRSRLRSTRADRDAVLIDLIKSAAIVFISLQKRAILCTTTLSKEP